ncbi:MAG: PDZ domain-containing protein [Gammaproteobacteria bacterium]|nr:PDZ domain-containing protein [Gammaproteobacteria bacterium]
MKNDGLSLVLTGKSWAEASDLLRKRYERVVKRIDQISGDDVFETFMNAYARAYDPHSSYFSPRNSEEYRIAMSLSYEGIGASLQLVDDYVTVLSILPGGPAAASDQLSTNDRITAVGQGKEGALTDVIGWRLDDVVQLIRGPVGTVVRLQILPAGRGPGRSGARHPVQSQQGHARGAGGTQGSAQSGTRWSEAHGRGDHRAQLLPGLQRAGRG